MVIWRSKPALPDGHQMLAAVFPSRLRTPGLARHDGGFSTNDTVLLDVQEFWRRDFGITRDIVPKMKTVIARPWMYEALYAHQLFALTLER